MDGNSYQHSEENAQYMQQQQMQRDMYGDEQDYGQEQYMQQMQMQQSESNNALNLQWVVGFNLDIDQGVHFLTDENRTEIFYTAAHTGVIFDYRAKSQKLLQGHCNNIKATACSENKRWVVTADIGDDSMLVVWDSLSATPVRTFLNPHPNGVKVMDLSSNNQYIVTLGAEDEIGQAQTISLWDWLNEKQEGPIVSLQLKYTDQNFQLHWIKFNPSNHFELVANGNKRVSFLSWEQGSEKFDYYAARVESKDFANKERFEKDLTKSVFIPNSDMAVTGTKGGDILVWDQSLIIEGVGEQNEKRLIKVVTLIPEMDPNKLVEINQMMTIDTGEQQYLVCGDSNGTIRFFDPDFKAEAWFEDQNLGGIKSISFSNKEPVPAKDPHEESSDEDDKDRGQNSIKEKPFKCSDFIVADSNAMIVQLQSRIFEAIKKEDKSGETLMVGLQDEIVGVSVHPHKTILAIASSSGFVILWDYMKRDKPDGNNYEGYTRENRNKEEEKKEKQARKAKEYTCIQFTPDGKELLVGRADGQIIIIDPETAKSVQQQTALSTCAEQEGNTAGRRIKQLVVSDDNKFFATSDADCCVSLFKYDHYMWDTDKPIEWFFLGKHRTHTLEITSICFGQMLDADNNVQQRLFSIGADRRLFEYSTADPVKYGELEWMRVFDIELEANPTACIWYPNLDLKEGLILTTNDEYKMKLWNPTTENSRRTCLGPTYGGEINKLKLLNNEDRGEKYLLYSTNKKVIGLIKLPLDGNPNKTMGLIAHPDEVADICVSSDGRFVFTCGGKDLAVNVWAVDTSPIDQAIAIGGDGIEPFINLIEGGREGQTFQDMNDFFYYSMIRSEKENTTRTRKLVGKVPVEEIKNLMRAMGYYPTEQEVKNMIDEVRFSVLADKGQPTTHVKLDDFIKLFVNHRPVYGIGQNNIEEAFDALLEAEIGDANGISREELIQMLTKDCEDIEQKVELPNLLELLTGQKLEHEALKDVIDSKHFAEDVLGFEEVDENELDGEDGYDEAAMQMSGMGMGKPDGSFALGTVPEEV